MDSGSLVFLVASALAMAGAVLFWSVLHQKRRRRDAALLARAVEEARHVPPSLHPVIDPDACIGSLSCVRACPEGDVLGIAGHAATLIEAGRCIGHGRCALECPVGAIKLVFGTSERGVDLPEVDENFESSRPGVFIVGELGGMGLIKNAFSQGLQAGAYLGEALGGPAGAATAAAARAPAEGVVDVAIVGAGPAGIAAAIALRQARRSLRILEQSKLGGTVAHYPRQKIVMTERARIPGFGAFGKSRMSKEELIEGLERLVKHFQLEVEEGVGVASIEGEDGAFVVHTSRGEVRAKKVILAIGRRGTPRTLGVPGEELEKVTYSLLDPEQYLGKRVLVVGGGDSAVEAACSLARAGVETVISYRGPGFNRCRAANREAIEATLADGRLTAVLESEVRSIAPSSVTLAAAGSERTIDNDFVLVCAGGELPLGFLKRSGIELVRHHGDKEVTSPSAKRMRKELQENASGMHAFDLLLLALGTAAVLLLWFLGREYYLSARAERAASPFHADLRSAGLIGHGIGVAATLVMLSNFIYPLRKRWPRLKGALPIERWLSFHVFVGIMSPISIAFHAAFQSNNTIATATFAALLLVVMTGLTGRFAYALIPTARGKTLELSELSAQLERLRAEAHREASVSSSPERLKRIVRELTSIETTDRPLLALIARAPKSIVDTELRLRSVRSLFADQSAYRELVRTVRSIARMKVEIEFFSALRRFMSWWRVLHVVLAVFLVAVMTVHIVVSIYLGFRWVWV